MFIVVYLCYFTEFFPCAFSEELLVLALTAIFSLTGLKWSHSRRGFPVRVSFLDLNYYEVDSWIFTLLFSP